MDSLTFTLRSKSLLVLLYPKMSTAWVPDSTLKIKILIDVVLDFGFYASKRAASKW